MSDEQIKNFILLVDTMRAKQKVYFRGRMGRDLEAAKKYENEVDRIIRECKAKHLEKKINQAIRLIQTTCANKDDVEVAYSGGKDSDVVLQLAKEAGIKFTARYKSTTIDPPGTIKHCKDMGVEILKPAKTFKEIVNESGFPWAQKRTCCKILKEYKTVSGTVILGIRAEESRNRKERYKEPTQCKIVGGERIEQIFPILYWTDSEIEEFINDRGLICHPLYYDDNGVFHRERRLGCSGCPLMGKKKRRQFFEKNNRWLKFWIKCGESYYKNRTLNVYEYMVGTLFYHKMRDLEEIQNGLFGKMDCKEILERRFNIKL